MDCIEEFLKKEEIKFAILLKKYFYYHYYYYYHYHYYHYHCDIKIIIIIMMMIIIIIIIITLLSQKHFGHRLKFALKTHYG